MTAAEAKFVELEDKKKRKQWTDQQRQKRLKKNHVGSPPPKKLGFTSDRLRTMVDVEANRLLPGHMFPTKEIFWMRIGEEALLRNIQVRAIRSDLVNLVVKGPNFYVAGNFREGLGWTCKVAVCREGDDLLLIPPIGKYENERAPLKTPLSYLWVVPIFRQSVEKKPGVDYEALRDLLRPYANEYAITDAILQEGRETAKVSIFGTPEENAGYAEAVAATMRSLGHEVELVYTTRAETLANINTVVVQEEVNRRKKKKEAAFENVNERKSFWHDWKERMALFLSDSLGIDGGPAESKFLSGILVATSSSKEQFANLQEVVQADGAHTSFGKYTLFSAYATTANGNMATVAFGILFGNEDIKNWSLFWKFVAKVHPTINRPEVTVLTDQDKGSIVSIAANIPLAHNFHCSYHRRQNILSTCGGGSGKKPLTALWMFNMLTNCNNMLQLRKTNKTYMDQLHPSDKHYLTKIADDKQYAAARCAMGDNICMYGRSASSGVESMNRANKLVREKTAIDILNAAVLLLKLEGERYNMWKEKAWLRDLPLTPRGMEIMQEIFDEVNVREYRVNMEEDEMQYIVTVAKNTDAGTTNYVRLPKVAFRGSYFGTCTCGVPKKEGVPCRHMVVIVKSSLIGGLTRVGIMPYFWTTPHWQRQYPLEVVCNTDISMTSVKVTGRRDDKIQYCPDWSVGGKSGRPKKHTKEMTVMDHIEASSKKKRKRRVKMYCKICEKWNHTTLECFKNPINCRLDDKLGEVLEKRFQGEDGEEGVA